MKLVWSREFQREIRREYEFIQLRNPRAAEAVVDRIFQACRRLREFPQSGRSWRLAGTSELIIPGLPYIVIYRIKADTVEILNLFHSSREGPHVH